MRHVILPQAVRNILPAMCNEFVTIIKETSILGMVGIVELMFRAQSIAKQTYIFLEPYVNAAIMYFIIEMCIRDRPGTGPPAPAPCPRWAVSS